MVYYREVKYENKKINDLSKYEAEFTITDGSFDVYGTCISLPLPDNRIPEIGSHVSCLYAFFLTDNPNIKKLYRQSEHKYILKKMVYLEWHTLFKDVCLILIII